MDYFGEPGISGYLSFTASSDFLLSGREKIISPQSCEFQVKIRVASQLCSQRRCLFYWIWAQGFILDPILGHFGKKCKKSFHLFINLLFMKMYANRCRKYNVSQKYNVI